ncbi:uncharacterized protein HGUI_03740 [Hanseniaspora guilliermondii]|uniref:Cytochrome c oxidase assembly protein COX20, mitochondrial n=1 Tax=Hanseniaspora guilliermondii TaxID=56406 RepID=A0A1L0B8S4_9ASCO|nr:uncharacterized protein HGUI_03740 [Hanseniaspora guilliermondii]
MSNNDAGDFPVYKDENSNTQLKPKINPDNIRIYTKDKSSPNYNPDEFLLEKEQELKKQRDQGLISQSEFDEQLKSYTPGQKIVMRDEQRKYKQIQELKEKHPEYTKKDLILRSFSLDDFKFSNLLEVSCFRQAMLLGLSTGMGLGTVIFLTTKTVTKTTNWSMIGFFSGSIFGWEKCRYQRSQQSEIENRLRRFQEIQKAKLAENQSTPSNETDQDKKKWYKPW